MAIRSFDIVQRELDKKWVVWAEIDSPEIDREWYVKNGLAVPQIWVPVSVNFTKDAAIKATKTVRL